MHVFFGDELQVGVKTLRGRRSIDDALVGFPIGIRLAGNAETHVFPFLCSSVAAFKSHSSPLYGRMRPKNKTSFGETGMSNCSRASSREINGSKCSYKG